MKCLKFFRRGVGWRQELWKWMLHRWTRRDRHLRIPKANHADRGRKE